MKIGVLTFWQTSNNYGQILQMFALQSILRSHGHSPYIIRYFTKQEKGSRSICKLFRNIFQIRRYIFFLYRIFCRQPDRKFDEFRKIHLNATEKLYYSIEELRQDPPEADVYITGSDQVWNYTHFSSKPDSAFFLDFGQPTTKRIAYAPSFGMKEYPTVFHDSLVQNLALFDQVSVRDRDSLEICHKHNRPDAVQVPDPTLLLPPETYSSLFEGDLPIQKYCFIYRLGGDNMIFMPEILSFCQKNKLLPIYVLVNWPDLYKKTVPTIGHWLNLIAHADFVITNSFHGTVFSLLFQRRFVTYINLGNNQKSNGRIFSLLQEFNATDHLRQKRVPLDTYLNLPGEYTEKLISLREAGRKFLFSSLEKL